MKKRRGRPKGQKKYIESFSFDKPMRKSFAKMREDGYNCSRWSQNVLKKAQRDLGYV